MTPPSAFDKYCLPFYQKQSEIVKQTGKPYFLHIDGKFRQLVESIKISGISGIESVSSPEIGGDLEFHEAQTLLQEMVMIPNFPSNLALSKEDIIMAYVNNLKEQSKNNSFMLQVSEDIPAHSWKYMLPILTKALYNV